MNPLELNNGDLDRSKNHISSVSNNTLNLSQNRVSAFSISYISYFYHVFPLHVNSFNRLFSDVISPKLSILISFVTRFTCLTTDIPGFKSNLEDVSNYLNNNPAQSLLKSIQSFDSKTYVDGVRDNINVMITSLESKIKYDEIILNIKSIQTSVVSGFTDKLKTSYEDFKDTIQKHKESLKENINQYIDRIKEDLTGLCTCAKKLSGSISKGLESLETNEGKLSQFTFENYMKLMKPSQPSPHNGSRNEFNDQDRRKLETIVNTHKEYEKCLTESFENIKTELNKLMEQLKKIKDCSDDLTSKLATLSSGALDTSKIDEVSTQLKGHNSNLEFDKYKGTFEKLQKINEYITTMKSELKPVENKVVEGASNYIEGLDKIEIKGSDVKEKIDQITKRNELVIKKLEIAKSASGFYKSLKDELDKLNHNSVNLNSKDFTEIYKNSTEIHQKLECFQSTIDSELTSTNPKIKKCEEEIKTLNQLCHGIQKQDGGEDDKLISSKLKEIQKYYTEEIPNITSFINNSSEIIRVINYILHLLEENKTKSLEHINGIKTEVNNISGLGESITKLAEPVKKLKHLVQLQEYTKSLIDTFKDHHKLTSLSQYSHKLQDSITLLYALIRYTELSKKFLREIKLLDSLVKSIKDSYKRVFEKIKQIFENFKDYVNVITSKLETINGNLCELKCRIEFCCPGYNKNSCNGDNACNSSTEANPNRSYDLYKLKDYINNLKYYLIKIKTHFTTIKVFLDKIKQESLDIEEYGCELENLQQFIEDYNKCLEKYKQGPEKILIDYLKSIKDRINEIITILKYLIDFNKGPNCIKKIETKLNLAERSINDLECAIEAVVRNTIRCSLKSLSNHLTNSCITRGGVTNKNDLIILNYSILNVTNYKSVIDRLYEIWSFSDEAIKLFNFIWLCKCDQSFRSKYRDERPSSFPYSLHSIRTTDLNPVSELARNTMAENVGNHLCLCLVIKYHLRPAMLKCILYLRNEDLGSLSSLSRKHDKYNPIVRLNSDLWKLYCLVLSIIYRIVYWIKHKHNFVWVEYYSQPEIKCFCTIKNTVEYHYFISMIIYLSSIIENIWDMDTHSIRVSIECLSSLLSEYKSIHVYTNYYSSSLYNLRNILGELNKVKLEGTSSHTVQVANRVKETLVKSKTTSTTTITEKNNESTTTTYAITTAATHLLKNSIKGMLVSVNTMIIGTQFSKESFELIYTKYSHLIFYTQNQSILNTSSIKTLRYPRIKIPIKCLEKICQQSRQECNCTVTNKESKICPIAKIRMSGISISLKRIEVVISNLSKDILLDYLIESVTISEDFFSNLCVGFGEVYTAMTKNNYGIYTDHKNIANTFPSLTLGYGYESVYEHETTGNSGYTGINGIRECYSNIRSGIIAIINKLKPKERGNVYTLENLHTRVKTQNNIKNYQEY